MPQTGTTDGHAHLHEVDGTRTTATNLHWHRIIKGQQVTGPAIPVGSLKDDPDDPHRHDVPDQ